MNTRRYLSVDVSFLFRAAQLYLSVGEPSFIDKFLPMFLLKYSCTYIISHKYEYICILSTESGMVVFHGSV